MFNYSLKGHTLNCVESTKYLGVEISHIGKAVKKGSWIPLQKSLNKHRRSKHCCTHIYLTCSTKFRGTLLEMVQWRAALYITNGYHNTSSVTDMLDHLDMESLESRRTKAQLIMMFRINNSLVDVTAQRNKLPASSQTRATDSHKYR